MKVETVKKLVQENLKDDKSKITADAVLLITEVLNVFVAEAACRSAKQADRDSSPVVTREQFEKILPQLVSFGFLTVNDASQEMDPKPRHN
ncbi:hypothetical protein LSH36_217g03000 [Paralvinella palmiformis]|uniref:Centromere protein X n=1 Tax=Paralvinella palmiformis TaxID=53620 RepID=A0AAD9N5Z5_9ANNE|nr:hypothetical protein LSH36_217g03000 [Paralvinella palmiformis]